MAFHITVSLRHGFLIGAHSPVVSIRHNLVRSKEDLVLSTVEHCNTAQKFWYPMRPCFFLLSMLLLQLPCPVLHTVAKKGVRELVSSFLPLILLFDPLIDASFDTRPAAMPTIALSLWLHSPIIQRWWCSTTSVILAVFLGMPRWGKNEGQVHRFAACDQKEILILLRQNTQFTDLSHCRRSYAVFFIS